MVGFRLVLKVFLVLAFSVSRKGENGWKDTDGGRCIDGKRCTFNVVGVTHMEGLAVFIEWHYTDGGRSWFNVEGAARMAGGFRYGVVSILKRRWLSCFPSLLSSPSCLFSGIAHSRKQNHSPDENF